MSQPHFLPVSDQVPVEPGRPPAPIPVLVLLVRRLPRGPLRGIAVLGHVVRGTRDAERLRRHLRREGYEIDEAGRIRLPARLLPLGALAAVRSPRAPEVLLARVESVLPDDPMLAIGTAKELVEATCHTVLAQLGEPVAAAVGLPELVYRAESALGVHPQHGDGMDGVPQMRALLGRLTAITNDLAALRSQAGSGHGRAAVPRGLAPRHGRLALNAAFAWCRFVLDTFSDPEAAWRVR
jgi:hypothetical protein